MENASKALLMAGGVLLVMLVIGLLLFAWTQFSEFYNKSDDLAEIRDISEFNLQFTNYDRDDVHGYELISLANKVADYNFRYSNYIAQSEDNRDARNNEGYTPITMEISFPGDTAKKLWYDETERKHFFNPNQTVTQSSTINQILNIQAESKRVEDLFGNTSEASKVARSINSFSENQRDYYINVRKLSQEEAERVILDYYNSLVKAEEAKASSYSEIKTKLTNIANIYEYYEYYQFKKAIFKCTGVEYDNTSERVSKITFVFTGEIE